MAVAGRRSLGAGSLPMADRGSRRHGAALPGSLAAPPRLTSGSGWQGTQRGPARISLALRLGLNLGYRCGKAQDQRPRRTNEVAAGGDGARRRCPLAGVLSSPLRSAMCQGLAFVRPACPYASVTSLMATTWLGSAALVSALGHTASASRLPPLPETRTSVKPAASSLLAISWLSARPSSQPSAILAR